MNYIICLQNNNNSSIKGQRKNIRKNYTGLLTGHPGARNLCPHYVKSIGDYKPSIDNID